jgi:hypothetical protein
MIATRLSGFSRQFMALCEKRVIAACMLGIAPTTE